VISAEVLAPADPSPRMRTWRAFRTNPLGIGSLLVAEAERRLQAMGCGKINLQIRAGNEAVAAFYRRHGYEVEERVSMGKRLDK